MVAEADVVPFEAAAVRGERLLVLAPHPDDEVIGCGGLLAQHVREHRQIRVIVATDGTAAEEDGGAGRGARDAGAYLATREQESRNGLALFGDPVAIDFFRFPDRGLEASSGALEARLLEVLRDFRPDLIAAPSPIEIHPDHLALAEALCAIVQRDETLFADLGVTRVAFYEVSQPIRPNALVDISDVAETKFAAIRAHESQIAIRDYTAFARGLNAYRAMTLPPPAAYAEAYWIVPLQTLRTMPFSAVRDAVGGSPHISVERETIPISVIVRTKDRPALLREALASIRASNYPAEIVVVNDGGEPTGDLGEVTLVQHEQSHGRSVAANEGVRAAKSDYISFLDDDDLQYPEHLKTLAAAATSTPPHVAWYSDAVSAFVRLGENGAYETHARLRLFGGDFHRDRLLVDNFIPLPTLLIPREKFLDAGGFDPQFDLFEDWEFLIRLSALGRFAHVPRVTCEIRHIEGGGSITIANPEGSDAFREAKLAVWERHASEITNDVIANAFELQKRRLNTLVNDAVVARGARAHLDRDVARLERDKATLLGELQEQENRFNAATIRIQSLEGTLQSAESSLESLHAKAQETAISAAREIARDEAEIGRLTARTLELQTAFNEHTTTIEALYNEIARLQNLLDTIFASRTWKLHTMVERMKGRK